MPETLNLFALSRECCACGSGGEITHVLVSKQPKLIRKVYPTLTDMGDCRADDDQGKELALLPLDTLIPLKRALKKAPELSEWWRE